MKATIFALAAGLLAHAPAHAELRLHNLPRDNGQEVASVISGMLPISCQTPELQCGARFLTNGQIVVEAPDDVQSEVADLLRAIAERAPEPVRHVTLQYWILRGAPGAADADLPDLRPLRRVLDALEDAHGELGFGLVDRRSLTSVPGMNASLTGDMGASLRQQIRANGEVLTAELSVTIPLPTGGGPGQPEVFQHGLSANVTIEPGAFVVLGESTARGGAERLFYIVQWAADG